MKNSQGLCDSRGALRLKTQAGVEYLMDKADLPLVEGYRVHGSKQRKRMYIAATRKGVSTPLHRLIMDAKPGQIVDHVNRDGTDNRRCNLRFATHSQNMINSRRKNKSGYIGVTEVHDRWKVEVNHGRKVRMYGFKCPIEAAKARDKLALYYQGEFAVLNFPNEKPKEVTVTGYRLPVKVPTPITEPTLVGCKSCRTIWIETRTVLKRKVSPVFDYDSCSECAA